MLQEIYCATVSETSEQMCPRADKWRCSSFAFCLQTFNYC